MPHWLFDNAGFHAQLVKAREVNGKRLGVIAKPITRAMTKRRDCDFCSPEELERALRSAKVDAARACTIDDLSRALRGSKSEARSQGGEAFDEVFCIRYHSQGGETFVQSNASVTSESKHNTSVNLGLAADSLAQPDYDMASSESIRGLNANDEWQNRRPLFSCNILIKFLSLIHI